MTLRLYNTLTRTKEPFEPIDRNNVRMYVCGPTVYDFAHIGNARPVIVFDVLYRLLKHLYPGAGKASDGSRVEYVRNITDVDDKINARALRDFPDLPLNEAIRRVTEKTANQFFADAKALGCLEPTEQPRATDNIRQMIEMIEALIARGHAYVAEGEVLFSVPSMPDYGALSQRNLDDQQAGARIAVEAHKRNPADFVLWKLSSPEEPGWDSPWGRGRPGWHIECSAMSKRYLGEVFDIHGGGLDLIFPHHENEIAQSRCAHGTQVMANVWMHNGFLQVEGQKMSKSLGNFVTIREVLEWSRPDVPVSDPSYKPAMELLEARHGAAARLLMLRTHYRQPIDWTRTAFQEAKLKLASWRKAVLGVDLTELPPVPSSVINPLCDDLNTHLTLTAVDDLAKQAMSQTDPHDAASNLAASMEFLGFSSELSHLRNKGSSSTPVELAILGLNKTDVDALVTARLEARKAKNWAESDRIRDELAAMGIAIKDNKDGTTSWDVKR